MGMHSIFQCKIVFALWLGAFLWDRSFRQLTEGDQPWVFFGRNDATAETPVLWPPHAKSWLVGKDSDAGRDWGQEEEERRRTEDEMVRWHHWLDGCESEWTPEVGDGQGGLACCDSWGCKASDMTERLNWTDMGYLLILWAIAIFNSAVLHSHNVRAWHVIPLSKTTRGIKELEWGHPGIHS